MTDHVTEIKNRLTIEQVAAKCGLEINRSGFVHSIYKEDKTPSLKIYPVSNSYFCFATNQGGDLIDFYKDYYNIEFAAAIKELCELAGISTSSMTGSERSACAEPRRSVTVDYKEVFDRNMLDCLSGSEKEKFNVDVKEALDYDRIKKSVVVNSDEYNALKNTENRITSELKIKRIKINRMIFSELMDYCKAKSNNEDAEKYLIDQRKFTPELLNRFMIFTIGNYNKVNNHMKKTFTLDDLKRSGLYNDKGNLIFYNHRIIIPYLWNGWPVYLRGRYFDGDGSAKSDSMKYIGLRNDGLNVNTPKRFFNADILNEMLPGEKLYIVEGEFDTVAMTQLGYNAIGIPGAGNTPAAGKFVQLKKFNVVLCMDNDEAGAGLRTRLTNIFLNKLNKEISTIELPTKDVNEFIAEGVI